MAWRIDEQVIRGEIDNTTKGRVTGRIWLVGREEPLELDLIGNAHRDLAGHVLCFTNPEPKAGDLTGLTVEQGGWAGDITASRKVKVPDCSQEEFMELYAARKPFPWHWSNSLYLEWFSRRNGRVVIESAIYQMEIGALAAWRMTPEEEAEQRTANAQAMLEFMENLGAAVQTERGMDEDWIDDEDDDDAPRSPAEAEADDEAARMDLLLDRVTARLEKEGHDEDQFERILDEERERLRRERGEPEEEPLTPEQEQAHAEWIEEMNAIHEEALAEMEAEKWQGNASSDEPHPLVERCGDLAAKLYQEVRDGSWLPADASHEHPIGEIVDGVTCASAKLAGALNSSGGDDDAWPPPPLFAGDTLVRLKKARGYLRDALRGLDSADQENLAVAAWRMAVRREVQSILTEVRRLIAEVREVLGGET